jgi:hypothetical protein
VYTGGKAPWVCSNTNIRSEYTHTFKLTTGKTSVRRMTVMFLETILLSLGVDIESTVT